MSYTVEVVDDRVDGREDNDVSFYFYIRCFSEDETLFEFEWSAADTLTKEDMKDLVNGRDTEADGVLVRNGKITFSSDDESSNTMRYTIRHSLIAAELKQAYRKVKRMNYYD